jgi:predicted nucleotidyltransferase
MGRIANLKPLTDDEILTEIANIIMRYYPGAQIFLFGSRAKGDVNTLSDYDIAIDINTKIPLETISRIKDEIDKLPTLKTIDITDLNRVNMKFKKIVLKTGVNISARGRYTT